MIHYRRLISMWKWIQSWIWGTNISSVQNEKFCSICWLYFNWKLIYLDSGSMCQWVPQERTSWNTPNQTTIVRCVHKQQRSHYWVVPLLLPPAWPCHQINPRIIKQRNPLRQIRRVKLRNYFVNSTVNFDPWRTVFNLFWSNEMFYTNFCFRQTI